MMTGARYAREQQYIYRNTAVEIEPGRYALTGYTVEPVIHRELEPPRATEGRIARKVEAPLKKRGPGGPLKHPPAEQLQQTKGAYKLVRTEPFPSGQSFSVIAVCDGGHCGGRVRKFSVNQWWKGPAARACGKCTNEIRKAERQAWRAKRKAAGLPVHNTRGNITAKGEA